MNEIKDNTKKWFEEWILKLNLCPFAHSVYAKKQIRFEIEESENFEKCVQKAVSEITFLEENNDDKIQNYVDTTLLIFPNIFLDCDKNSNSEENILFNDFLDFVAVLDLFFGTKQFRRQISSCSFSS